MKKLVLFAAVAAVFTVYGFAHAEDIDRAGRLGVGPSFSGYGYGPGLRYWLTNRLGVNAGGYFAFDKGRNVQSSRNWGADGALVVVLKQKGLLRLNGLVGASYDRTRSTYESGSYRDEWIRKVATVGGGLGVEYSFQELPDLGFEAFFTGIGVDFVNEDRSTTSSGTTTTESDTYQTFSSSPRVGLNIRYYF